MRTCMPSLGLSHAHSGNRDDGRWSLHPVQRCRRFTPGDLHALGIDKPKFVAVTGCQIKEAAADHVVLTMPAQWTGVVAVNREEAKGLGENSRKELEEWRGAK